MVGPSSDLLSPFYFIKQEALLHIEALEPGQIEMYRAYARDVIAAMSVYQTNSCFCYGTQTWPPRHHPLNLLGLDAYAPYMNTGEPLDKLSKVLSWRGLAINSNPIQG